MDITRRDFLKASSAVAAALGMQATGIWGLEQALASTSGLAVVWLQGQNCSGCSVSLLNSIYYSTIDNLLVNTINLKYHNTLMAAAGQQAINTAKAAENAGKYVLVVEGAIPSGEAGKYCTIWPGMTIEAAVKEFAANTPFVVAVGTCASFGGMAAARGGVTSAHGVQTVLGTSRRVVNIAGCPANPDWVVGTIAYMIQNGAAPALDSNGRPTSFYGRTVHSQCPYREEFNEGSGNTLGRAGCQYPAGCKGPKTHADCPSRRWNSAAANTRGTNWCVFGRAPCHGCTEPSFPDGMSPILKSLNLTAPAGDD